MTEETQPAELTQEQKDAASAAAYREQLEGARVDAPLKEVAESTTVERPEHIPEKFWDAEKGEVNVEAMAKSYAELEKARATPEPTPEEKAAAEAAKSDVEKAQAEFVEHRQKLTDKLVAGEALDDSDYKPFIDRGFTKQDIDDVIEGQKARAELETLRIHKEVGGAEVYADMVAWAKANWSADEIHAYNRDVVGSNDPAVNLNAVRGLAARYHQANGRSGKLISGGGKGTEGYASKAEMVADMRDPKYTKDPAFRAEVARKVAAARRSGVDLSA